MVFPFDLDRTILIRLSHTRMDDGRWTRLSGTLAGDNGASGSIIFPTTFSARF